jgi:hypothetical protein
MNPITVDFSLHYPIQDPLPFCQKMFLGKPFAKLPAVF